MFDSNNLQYIAIAHIWDNGSIDYINVLNNRALTTSTLDGGKTPDWFRERVALLRLCEVNKVGRSESIGRKFTDHMMYVYLDSGEYKQLISIINSGDKSETD